MLLRHSVYYFLARGLPGLVNFAALALFTRLLAPDEFGRYALVITGVGLANVIIFQWLRLVLARFLQASRDDLERFLAGIFSLFITLAVVVTGLGVSLGLLWPDPVWRRLLVLAVLLLVAEAWFELNQSLAQAELKPGWYGKLLGSKALIYLVVGGVLAWLGLGAAAPILGLLFAYCAAVVLFALGAWRGITPHLPHPDDLRAQLRYGLPLIVTFALTWVVSGSDRLIIALLLNESAVGMYAAGYDLAFQSLTMLLTIINTAAYPLAVNAMVQGGNDAARKQLEQNGQLIIAAAFTGGAGLIALNPYLVNILIGEEFRSASLAILPWVAFAAAIAGIKSYHFDLAFQLSCKSYWLVLTGGVAAILNIVLNLVLIPSFGIVGAAWATLASYGMAAITSAWLGSRLNLMPYVIPLLAKAVIVAGMVGITAWLSAGLSEETWMALMFGLLSGIVMAFLASLLMNLCGLRTIVLVRLKCRFFEAGAR